MKLEDVKWAYVATAEGFRATGTPGVLVSEEAVPEGKAVPPALSEKGRWVLEELLGEYDATIPGPVEMEALLFSGNVKWWMGEEWWEFSTLSSYSVTLWVGKLDGCPIFVESFDPAPVDGTDDPLRAESYPA